jgi:hypothetical protein
MNHTCTCSSTALLCFILYFAHLSDLNLLYYAYVDPIQAKTFLCVLLLLYCIMQIGLCLIIILFRIDICFKRLITFHCTD